MAALLLSFSDCSVRLAAQECRNFNAFLICIRLLRGLRGRRNAALGLLHGGLLACRTLLSLRLALAFAMAGHAVDQRIDAKAWLFLACLSRGRWLRALLLRLGCALCVWIGLVRGGAQTGQCLW